MKTKIGFTTIYIFTTFTVFGQTYCTPTFDYGSIFIENFAFHTLVNTYSGASLNSYTFYPDTLFTTSVTLGKKYPISISMELPIGAPANSSVWIDYNNDYVFDSTELVHFSSGTHSTSGIVTIPNDTNCIGKRRMRVIYSWKYLPISPCGNLNWTGEAEDYEITIVANQADTQTYCTPFNPSGKDGFIIDNFHLNAIQNDSSGSNSTSYIFYPISQFTTDLQINQSYPIYISCGQSAGIPGRFALWIDLNNDGLFSKSEKLFQKGPNYYWINGIIQIPNDTSFIGMRRLRIRSAWGQDSIGPCNLSRNGEAEDYMVNILPNTTSVINFNPEEANLIIYPNPSRGLVNIASNSVINEIMISDLMGRKIFYSQPKATETSISIENSGIYILTLFTQGSVLSSKVIID